MHEVAATPSWVLIAYLVSGICFILALRGLSSPSSSQGGNRLGMIGIVIAVATTLATHAASSSQPPRVTHGLRKISVPPTLSAVEGIDELGRLRQAGDVRDIGQEVRADLVRNGAELLPVGDP